MKKIITNKKFSLGAAMLLTIAIISSVLIYACKKPTDGINVLVDSQLLSPGATTVVFANADSTSTNQPSSFPVTISGPGASLVQMISGGTNFQVSHGMLPLSLVKGTNPSPTNPVTFTVTGQATGFATPFIKTITLTSTDPALYVVKAFDYSTTSPGTTLLTKTTSLTAGTLSSGLTLTTTTNSGMTENATIAFPTGTQMLDANKTPISASTLVCNVAQLGSGKDAIINDFPGGLFAQNALDKTGAAISGGVGFVPAAFLAISLTADGTPVKNFSKPVPVTVELNAGLTNFVTDAPVKVGDVIPYWSQNDQTGQWKYENDATVILDANNKLAVQMQITHLSNWMSGWFWSGGAAAGKAYGSCGSPFSAIITTPFPVQGLTIKMITKAGSIIDSETPIAIGQIGGLFTYKYTFASVPATGLKAELAAFLYGFSAPIAISSTFDPCSAGSITIPVGASALPSANRVENVAINIQGICTSKQVAVLPTATFLLYQQTTPTINAYAGSFDVINGVGFAALNIGSTYTLGTYYNGTYYQTNPFLVTPGALNIPAINGFNVTTTFDAPSNTLFLSGTIPVPCN